MLLNAITHDGVDVERFAVSFTAPERALLRDAAPMRVDRGCVIVSPGKAAAGLVVVLMGTVAVRMSRFAATPRLIDITHAGYGCECCAAITFTPNSWSVSARETTILLHLRRDEVGAAETRDPAVFEVLARRFCEHIEQIDVMLAVICERRPRVKVARVLLASTTRSGQQNLCLTQSQLGEMTHLSRNSVGRALEELAKERAITMGYRRVTVADRKLLGRVATLPGDGEVDGVCEIGWPQ